MVKPKKVMLLLNLKEKLQTAPISQFSQMDGLQFDCGKICGRGSKQGG